MVEKKKGGNFTHIENSEETFVKNATIGDVGTIKAQNLDMHFEADKAAQFVQTIKEWIHGEVEDAFRNILTEVLLEFPAIYQERDKKYLEAANEAIEDKRFEDAIESLESITHKTGKVHYQKGMTANKVKLHSVAADSLLEAFIMGENSLDELKGALRHLPRYRVDSSGEVDLYRNSFIENALKMDLPESRLLSLKGYFADSDKDKEKYLKRALRSNPDEVQALWGLFALYSWNKRPKSFRYAHKLLDSDQDKPEVYYNISFWLYRFRGERMLENKDSVIKLANKMKNRLPEEQKYCKEWRTIARIYKELDLEDESTKIDERWPAEDCKKTWKGKRGIKRGIFL